MHCRIHSDVPAVDRCIGCSEAFCTNCLVTIADDRYCKECKVLALNGNPLIVPAKMSTSTDARDGLKLAIVGWFCFGILVEPIAIVKSVQAKKEIASNPTMIGAGVANAALLISITGMLFWLIGVITKIAGAQ